MNITERVVTWAAQECSWQQSGELSVAWMLNGWRYAHRNRNRPITVAHIVNLGRLIEPIKNAHGIRKTPVRVGWQVMLNPVLIPQALRALVASDPYVPDWFREYEEIHPFVDGNGRTGSILFNWLRGSLPEPIHPPNLWNDTRRDYEGYPEPRLE
jgi:hypothetical protein